MSGRPVRPDVLRVLGIDPGGARSKHGFAILTVTRDNRATWEACGHTDQSPVALLRDAGHLDLVAVEEPATIHTPEATPTIVDVAVSAGEFLGAADALGISTAAMMPARWRNLVCGLARAGDKEVARAIALRIPSWPKRSNSHGRDAAGVALACAMTWPACLRGV